MRRTDVVCAVLIGLLLGCGPSPVAVEGVTEARLTRLSIPVWNFTGSSVDLARIDAAFAAVRDCYRYRGGKLPQVWIKMPELYDADGCGMFQFTGSPTGWAYGYVASPGDTVVLPPDLCAARHEFSHVVHRWLFGNYGEHGGGCWL